MKNVSLLIIAIAFCFSASAQSTSDTSHHRMHHESSQSMGGHYVMKDGKLMMDKGGTMSAVDNNVTLSNGTTITTDGKVTTKDGKTQTLNEGDKVSSTGKVWASKMKK